MTLSSVSVSKSISTLSAAHALSVSPDLIYPPVPSAFCGTSLQACFFVKHCLLFAAGRRAPAQAIAFPAKIGLSCYGTRSSYPLVADLRASCAILLLLKAKSPCP